MSTGWDKTLETGLRVMDIQHREYFRRVDKLLTLYLDDAVAPERMLEMFEFLNRYVVHHFGTEQKLMREHAYPDADPHVAQHAWMREQMASFETPIRADAKDSGLRMRFSGLLIDWFQNHIKSVDQRLADFLRVKVARS